MSKRSFFSPVILGMFSLSVLVTSCGRGPNDPGIEYAPDMYNSKGYEPFTQLEEKPNTINKDGKNMREPVKGTIAQGQMGYQFQYANNADGYEKAKAELKNPIPATPENLETGKRLYAINCVVCHGETGLADGPIVAAGKYPPPPSYQSDRIRTLPDGGMYHSITYGKNLMGPYGPHLTPDERWMVIHYIKELSKGGAAPASTPADTTASTQAATN